MKRYNRSALCPKCWEPEPATTWMDACPLSRLDKRRVTNDEHLERRCTRCGFTWAELPLDGVADLEQLGAVADGEET